MARIEGTRLPKAIISYKLILVVQPVAGSWGLGLQLDINVGPRRTYRVAVRVLPYKLWIEADMWFVRDGDGDWKTESKTNKFPRSRTQVQKLCSLLIRSELHGHAFIMSDWLTEWVTDWLTECVCVPHVATSPTGQRHNDNYDCTARLPAS